jgi:cell division inhibitor SepF
VRVSDSLRRVIGNLTVANDDMFDEDETMAPREEFERHDRPTFDAGGRGGRRGGEPGGLGTYASPTHGSGGRSVRSLALVSPPRVEVHLVAPRQFEDAQQIADQFRADRPVIVNMDGCQRELAVRLLDFCSGLTYALDGGLQRIDERVFLLTPRNVEISAETMCLRENGFFNQV